MEESRAILEEWENDREATLTYLESQGEDVFDSVVLSASRIGPVLKKTVLYYRYGHYALLGLTEDFVFVYDMVKGTVSDCFLVDVDYKLVLQHRHWTVCIDGPKLTNCALHHRSAEWRHMSEPATVSSHSQLPTVMCSVNQNRKTRLTASRQHVPTHSAPEVSTDTCDPWDLTTCVVSLPPAVRKVVCKTKQNSFLLEFSCRMNQRL